MLTEFGGIACVPARDDGRQRRRTAGATARRATRDELALMFERLLETVVHTALFSGFCYTQFADTFQEANGLLRADRTPKIPLGDDRPLHDRVAHAHPGRRLARRCTRSIWSSPTAAR